MFGARAYAQVGLESGVNSSSPHELILMLYDGAIESIVCAKEHMQNKRYDQKGHYISKAIRIVDEGLRAALDPNAAPQLVDQLESLYVYINKELLSASAKNDLAPLQVCMDLLRELRQAWDEAGQTARNPATQTAYAS